MKIAVITDTHLDARQSSPIFLQYMRDYYEEVFFPMLKEQNIKTILHLGDFTDNRNHISLSANKFMIDYFGQKLKEDNIDVYMPDLSLCTDNAAMIGSAGYYNYIAGNINELDLNAIPNLKL